MTNDGVIEGFNAFDSGSEAIADWSVSGIGEGLLNPAYVLTAPSGTRHFVQEMNQEVFDARSIGAIDYNLQLFEGAQGIARERGIVPDYWHDVGYLNVRDARVEGTKMYYDGGGRVWRVMHFVEGEVVNAYTEIPDLFPGKSMEDAAVAQGEAIAVFQGIAGCIQVGKYKDSLLGYHAPAVDGKGSYHYQYAICILDGKRIPFIFSQGACLEDDADGVSADWGRLDRIDNELWKNPAKYLSDGREIGRVTDTTSRGRVVALAEKLRAREDISHILDDVPMSVQHGDARINNMVYRIDDAGQLRVVCLIDLDTIMPNRLLDMGDALRSAGNVVGMMPPSLEDVRIDVGVVNNIMKGYLDRLVEGADEIRPHLLAAMKHYSLNLIAKHVADVLIGNKFYVPKPDYRPDVSIFKAEVQMRALEETERLIREGQLA